MENDSAVVFVLNSLEGIYNGDSLITPDKINKMMNCRSCQGKNGPVVTSALIEEEFYNLCSICSQKMCQFCSHESNFRKVSFFPLNGK